MAKKTNATSQSVQKNGSASSNDVKLLTAPIAEVTTPTNETDLPEDFNQPQPPKVVAAKVVELSPVEILNREVERTEKRAELVKKRTKRIAAIERLTALYDEYTILDETEIEQKTLTLRAYSRYNDEICKIENPELVFLMIEFVIDRLKISVQKIEEDFLKI